MNTPSTLHLAVALDGAGWHPAAWREPDARPLELLSPRYWTDLAQEAEWGQLDFMTIEDSLAVQSGQRGMFDDRTDQVRGRLDAGFLLGARSDAIPSMSIEFNEYSAVTDQGNWLNVGGERLLGLAVRRSLPWLVPEEGLRWLQIPCRWV